MKALNYFSGALALLLGTAIPLLATDVMVTSNVDVSITFSKIGGSQQTALELDGNKSETVAIDWAETTDRVSVEVISENPIYKGKTFESGFEEKVREVEPWDPSKVYPTAFTLVSHNGQVWHNKWYAAVGNTPGSADMWVTTDPGFVYSLDITLDKRNLPADTAYVPITVNTPLTLRAIPISMISGEKPSTEFTYTLEPRKQYVIKLPVSTDGTSLKTSPTGQKVQAKLIQRQGVGQLSLPNSYHYGKLNIYSLKGQKIARAQMTSAKVNRLAIWNAAAGMYIVEAVSQSGEKFVQKMHHTGGDISIMAQFTELSPADRKVTFTRQTRNAAEAEYRFEFDTNRRNYRDSSQTFFFTGKENSTIEIRLNTQPANLEDLMDEATYQRLFPMRYGVGHLEEKGDFYTYESLKSAIEEIAKYKATVYTKAYAGDRVVVEYPDGSTNTYYTTESGYESSPSKETSTFVDYSTLLNWGEPDEVKYELVAMLAHYGSETTGGPLPSSGYNRWECGLYWLHEVDHNEHTVGGYVVNHAVYPAEPGESYHGRGPKQLSYNYNYGQFSDFLYKDKNVILKNPNKVSEDGTLAFMSALWFWMTPQTAKPSCHMVMSGEWVPSAEDTLKNRHISKFGQTTNVINGGVECGTRFHPANDEKRRGHYTFFAEEIGVIPEDEQSCRDITHY